MGTFKLKDHVLVYVDKYIMKHGVKEQLQTQIYNMPDGWRQKHSVISIVEAKERGLIDTTRTE